jgi:hypothetical protein
VRHYKTLCHDVPIASSAVLGLLLFVRTGPYGNLPEGFIVFLAFLICMVLPRSSLSYYSVKNIHLPKKYSQRGILRWVFLFPINTYSGAFDDPK